MQTNSVALLTTERQKKELTAQISHHHVGANYIAYNKSSFRMAGSLTNQDSTIFADAVSWNRQV